MLRTTAALYLPISERLLNRVLDPAESFDDAVAGLPVPQIAALVVLQYLPRLESGSTTPGRILTEVIKSGNEQARSDGLPAFVADMLRVLERAQIHAGYRLLPDFAIALLDDDALKQRGYLTVEGEWDGSYCERHEARLTEPLLRVDLPGGQGVLTAEQSRIFREVTTQTDDHMHVQGYAGTGKSYLIKSLLGTLQAAGATTLVLAERRRQLDALLGGMSAMSQVHPRRFDQLIDEMVPADLIDPRNRRMSRTDYSLAPVADDDIMRHLGVQSSGELLAQEVVRIVRATVWSFCYSDDDEIDAGHIPARFAFSLDAATRQVVLHHATELWKAILLPASRDFRLPIRGYHRVKWAALKGWRIPARYTHVLIDECHDVAKPMLQILDRSPQAVISLGDEYQNLQGRPQQRTNVIRQRAVIHSVRSGQVLEEIVNPIITAHPGKTKLPFLGNPFHKTRIAYYDKPQLPERAAVIVVADTWGLFEWAQRLAEKVDFELLSPTRDLDAFVKDCIELHRHGTRPRHPELFRFGSWQALASRHYANSGFQRIDRMLGNGYGSDDWTRTSAKLVKHNPQGYALGLIDDVRNREFETVMLAPEVVDRVWGAERVALAAAGSALYVAITRAQRRLIVPERLRNWIEEISAT
ncbi:MAG TPA: AAA family ATPase [Povalibacter sp.]|nr:AAA family ATPase [Povalibacter sp.]